MALFNSCYAPAEEGEDVVQTGCGQCAQSGCGLVGIGAFEPILENFKKSLLSASSAVLKNLKKRQQRGRGKKKTVKKRQLGAGRKKKQRGAGTKKKSKAKKK